MIHNARITLLATALSNLRVGIIITGLIAPEVSKLFVSGTALVWPASGIMLHFAAQALLGILTP